MIASCSRSFPTIFDQDVFVGARLALNDVDDTVMLVGLVTDIEDGPESLRLEVERRLDDHWSVSLEAQVFMQDAPSSAASAFERDSFVAFTISRYF